MIKIHNKGFSKFWVHILLIYT